MIKAKLVQECSDKSKELLNDYTVQYGGVSGDEAWSDQPLKTYTSDTKIRKSFQCYFYQSTKTKRNKATKLHCQCILCQDVIQLFAVTGEVFTIPLLFPVESIWPIDGGLLIERSAKTSTTNTASSMGDQSLVEEGLPVMFSLLHPLDDISPVVCRFPSTGLGDQTILGYQCDPNMIVVYCSCDPSLLICCDVIGGRHSAWIIKPASDQDIPPVKGSISDASGSATPAVVNLSPAGKFPSTPSLPYPLQPTPSEQHKGHPSSRRDSPHYHMAQRESPFGTGAVLLPTRQQPRASPHKPTPLPNNAQQIAGITPRTKGSLSPVTLSPYAHTFQSSGSSWCTEEQSLHYLLLPNTCLKLVWEETNVPPTRTVTREFSTQVFFTEDVCNRKYLAMLSPVDKQLRLLQCTVKDEQSVQFGLTHDISASHAVPLSDLPLMAILSPNGQVLLYSGYTLVGEVCIDKCPTVDTVTGILSDCSRSHLTLVTSCDAQLHCSMPALPSHPLVSRILVGLVQVLPTAEACEALIHHYQYSHMFSYDQEWSAFQLWLTTMMGIKCYPVQLSKSADESNLWQRAVQSCDPMLLRSVPALSQSYKYHGYDKSLQSLPLPIGPAMLKSNRNMITYVMHLLYEDMKLNILYNANLEEMATLLHHIASQLQWEQYVDHYCRDFPCLFTKPIATTDGHVSMDEDTSEFSHIAIATTPPHIMQWLLRKLEGKEVKKFPIISNITGRLTTVIKLCGLYCWHANYPLALNELVAPVDDGQACSQEFQSACESYKNIQQGHTSYHARVILCLAQEDFAPKDLATLPVGIALLVQDCVTKCQHTPPTNWPVMAYDIIGREDIVKFLQPQDAVQGKMQAQLFDDDEDGMKMDCEVLNLRFSEDLRVNEVRKLLRSTQPVRIALTQPPEVSDHEFIEQQETRLLAVCQRTMALPIGRGMLTFSTCHPVPTAALFSPNLNLSGRAPPRNTTIGIDHIGAPAHMEMWPVFHNMVSAGLTVMPGLPHLDSAWIGYNKTIGWESTSNWAGFLMAMGLQGYLSQLTADRIYSITDKNHHELTTIGLLLGLAAEKCGSMDPQVAQLLALHCQPLLPLGSAELDVTHSVQVAALLGTGLLYMGSAQRHLVEVMLKEIGSPPGPELEYAVDRESYSLAAGLSLGMITLGCGNNLPGMTDLDMVDQLYHYINGGIKKTTSSTTKTGTHLILEGDHVNTHVTTAGAIMALTLMFLKTNSTSAANGLVTPDTLYQLEAIRPDFLLLRVLGHSLIMWDSVKPTTEWVQQHFPKLVKQHAFCKKSGTAHETQIDYETVSQAEVNIITGCCMSLGFRFAGTNDPEAFKTVLHCNKYLLSRIESTAAVDEVGRSCLEGCLNASLLALAMVMSGSGNLEVIRLVKKLRVRVTTPEVTYGSHMAIHMSLGLLFLGGGRYSLSTSNKAIAAMLCSFYPKFPSTSMDNRYHLQALRHLYVLAAEHRVLVTVDNDSGKTCSVPVCVKTSSGELTAMSPCIVPSWEDITEIKIDGPRYWEFTLNIQKSNAVTTTGIVFVKRRVGHLPYEDDKDGRCGDLSLAILTSRHHRTVHVDTESANHNALRDTNLKNFWNANNEESSSWNTFCSNVLTECTADEKLNVIPLYLQLEQLCHECNPTKMLDLWQFKLCQTLSSTDSITTSKMGGHSQETIGSVMSPEYLHSVEMSLLSRSETKGAEELDQLLGQYIKGDKMKMSPEQAELLATVLLIHDIPSKHIMQLGSNTTLPDLYLQLKSLGVSATAVTRLLPLLQL